MEKLLKKLIYFESDKNHPEEIKKCFDFVVSDLKKAGLKVKTYSSNNKPSLVAARQLKKHYQYILNGHLDVVPADYPHAFKPFVKGSRLYGRGASDMKGPDVALIQLIKNRSLKKVDMALMLTTDEEVGGFDGINYLINKKGYSCDCAVVPDGGDNFKLTLAEKGVIHLKLNAKGKAAHGSRPWMGENALDKLINLYQTIKKQIPETTPKNRWLTTVNLGKLVGGDAVNKVPAQAEMYLDFRFPEKKQKTRILKLIKKLTRKTKGIKTKILTECDLLINSKKNRYLQKIIKTAKKYQVQLKDDRCHGASDGRFFSAKSIPVIIFKPISSQAHIDHEWINLKSLQKFSSILKDFLTL
jgi:succinyl-diaminopimelate desuccinylase